MSEERRLIVPRSVEDQERRLRQEQYRRLGGDFHQVIERRQAEDESERAIRRGAGCLLLPAVLAFAGFTVYRYVTDNPLPGATWLVIAVLLWQAVRLLRGLAEDEATGSAGEGVEQLEDPGGSA